MKNLINFVCVMLRFFILFCIGSFGIYASANGIDNIKDDAKEVLLITSAASLPSKTSDEKAAARVLGTVEAKKVLDSLPFNGEVLSSVPKESLWTIYAVFWDIFSPQNFMLLMKTLVRILLISFLYVTLRRVLERLVKIYVKNISCGRRDSRGMASLMNTVLPIMQSALHWILLALTALLILNELDINILPIIYSFSILGLAVSIGSQTLAKDVINGLITLLEGNVAVGDYITVGKQEGVIENITLRCIHLRHSTGEIEMIPFSEISHIMNHSRDYTIADIQVTVAHTADFLVVEQCFVDVFKQMQEHPVFKDLIQGELIQSGVCRIDPWGVVFQADVKLLPDPSKTFSKTFNRLLAQHLKDQQVQMPLVSGKI